DTITGLNNITITGANNVDLEAVTLGGDLIQDTGTGITTLDGLVDIDGKLSLITATVDINAEIEADGGATIDATDITLGADITTAGTDIELDGAVERDTIDDVTLTSNDGDITVTGELTADVVTRNLTMDSGSGDIDFQDTITGLNNITITGANNVDLEAVTLGGDLIQDTGTGITTLDGLVDIDG
ncbi:MAG: hypothetical protein GY849_18810, partial [Deltaproteobacteria bacterium]|nr:hypothetical protein [Deltaproteobacteria bacterium]